MTSRLTIAALGAGQLAETASMLARAFVTNPLHTAVFGPGHVEKNEAFFRLGLQAMKGRMHVALDGARIVGAIHWVESPACQFGAAEKLAMLPRMTNALGVRSTVRVVTWLSIWSKHDPESAHVHLGPIGVDPDAQGHGVGRALMELYCAELDQSGRSGYLETDRPENVTFYRRFGFDVVATAPVAGVPNYFMRRG